MKFWEIAGAQNVEFFHTKCVSKMGRVRSPKRRVRDDDFMFGLSSDYPSNRPYIGGNNSGIARSILNSELRGRSTRVTLLAPRIVKDDSNVTRINHEIHFSWQVQYVVKLECHSWWQGHHFVKFGETMRRVRSPRRV